MLRVTAGVFTGNFEMHNVDVVEEPHVVLKLHATEVALAWRQCAGLAENHFVVFLLVDDNVDLLRCGAGKLWDGALCTVCGEVRLV